ncbi:hypothetical protein [Azospirillum brasilense]|uniref:hypothetical protein n=1 Tax=Azospirillum brasilense TaxID=192 RepID=UPI001EDB7FF6|nr:hypothetical protein [Azospirillum brasilense]UKJ75446.1 hypothetical protein H1Q64_14415 [Azospirillum brasilense]
MALLSATQGTPERVWSLLTVLAAHGGSMERQDLLNWLNPRFVQAGAEVKDEKSAADQTIQAALGLGLIDTRDRSKVRLAIDSVPGRFPAFSDLIHARLLTAPEDDADATLIQVFAWLVVQAEIEGSTLWVEEWSRNDFADKANDALIGASDEAGERRFNTTKHAPWRRWMEHVGLMVSLPTGDEYPDVTKRLARELLGGALPLNQEIAANVFLEHIAKNLPYLDGGRLFNGMCQRLGHRMPARAVSLILSIALRNLRDDGHLIPVVSGDARDNFELFPDPFDKSHSFRAIILTSEGV